MQMLEMDNDSLSIRQQTALLGLCRSSLYYKALLDTSEVANLIKEIYLDSDCRYGYRKVTKALNQRGYTVNHKKVLRLMQEMGLEGLHPRKPQKQDKHNHKIYPYLLEALEIVTPNQVWATDLTYIWLGGRFMYFIAIIDVYSRYIVAHDLLYSMGAALCVEVLKRALAVASPDIFNTDQGSQFTSHDFTDTLNAAGVRISMDHKGRCFDNIYIERLWRTLKQEALYYYRPETLKELEECLNNFVFWYNNKRLHQALGYKTPVTLYKQGKGIEAIGLSTGSTAPAQLSNW
jgi:putative transposase